jgi:hypothetical protein
MLYNSGHTQVSFMLNASLERQICLHCINRLLIANICSTLNDQRFNTPTLIFKSVSTVLTLTSYHGVLNQAMCSLQLWHTICINVISIHILYNIQEKKS